MAGFDKKEQSLPSGYLKGGYFKDGVVKSEYVINYAKSLADSLSSDRNALSTGKLRNYYNEVVNAYDNYERGQIVEAEAIYRVTKLYAKATQDVTKKKAPKLLADFLKLNIDELKTAKDLKAFKEHFESIVCFYPEKK